MATCEWAPDTQVRAASFPGGTSPQFRVQVFDHSAQCWQRHATFARREEAQDCWRALIADGADARIIDAVCVPAAF